MSHLCGIQRLSTVINAFILWRRIQFAFINLYITNMVNDWPKEFTLCKKPSEINLVEKWFYELRQTNPSDENHKETLRTRVENFKISRPEGKSIVSMIQLSPYDKQIYNKVVDVMSTLPPESVLKDTSKKKGNEKTKGKNGKKEVSKKDGKEKVIVEDTYKISVRAQLLIANKSNICVEQRDVFPSLRYTAVLPTSTKILTDDQDLTFVPLTVNIEHLEDLPLKFLRSIQLKKVFARYELGNVLDRVETERVVLCGTDKDRDIDLDDTRVFFVSSEGESTCNHQLMMRPSVLNLAESLMTRQMVVKLYGEVPEPGEVVVEPCLFGQKSNDLFISTPDHEMFVSYKHPPDPSTEVFLGSASLNLIRLVKGYCSLETTAVLTSDSMSTWDPAFDMEDLIDQVDNQLSRTAILEKFASRGVIPETLLLDHCTRITVTVCIGCQLSNLTEPQMINIPNIYQRIIVIFKDRQYAASIFEQIKRANSMFVDPYGKESIMSMTFSNTKTSLFDHTNSLFPASLVSNNRTLPSFVSQIREVQRVATLNNKNMTGFLVEDPEESILVLEAAPYIMPHVTESLTKLVPLDGRVIHDSSLFFTKRIYSDFFPTSMYLVRLSTPLSSLLQNSSLYVEKSPPDPALQALLLLDFIRRTRTLNSACINQLFPSCEQLISFNIAFGSTYSDTHRTYRS